MTLKEAKRELRPLKDMAKDIQSVEDEIDRLWAVATKMSTSIDPVVVTGTPNNRMEEAVVKLEEYKGRLSKLLIDSLDYKNRCLNKVEQIQPRSLQKILLYYYFQDYTLEKTAEILDRSVRWTYEMYKTALEKYSEI